MIIVLIILFTCFVLYISSYLTHIEMSKNEKLPYDFVHFSTFMHIFEKYKYIPTLEYDENFKSIFLKQDNKKKLFIYMHQ